VQVKGTTLTPESTKPQSPTALQADQLMTQRVLRVPVRPLLAGLSQYNIVIRPGDIIHVPAPPQGYVYMAGQVARPGPYTLPEAGRLTLIRAMASAGGLGALAIPERVDLTRIVGKNKQATIRLDFRAIGEGTMPDVYMKPDDIVNVGTNFWAYPLAVLRNGIRTSYGFGFVVDRNFDNEFFGNYQQFGTN
jgi:protein involved in polysaccharide export with SLBB domain